MINREDFFRWNQQGGEKRGWGFQFPLLCTHCKSRLAP